MDNETLIAKARALEDRQDLLDFLNEIKSELLGVKSYPFTLRQLQILCNPNNDKHRYYTFKIPKKSGGFRKISAPYGNLKWFQLCLNEVFKALYTPSPHATGFAKGRSIVDNARMHTNQHYVFNIDLRDFFPSIDQARVWKRLQLAPFNFNATIAGLMAGLCAIKSRRDPEDESSEVCYVLPQGAPTSPLLTNAVCDTLDRRLFGLAKRFGLHYSRYADDITFSSMHNVYQPGSVFRMELERIISGQRLAINEKKTRLSHCSTRQEVTGLTVGAKINVARKYVKDIRAILHIWEKYGLNAAFATFYPRYLSEKCRINRGEPNMENVISGKLSYLRMVKGADDPVYAKLSAQFSRIMDGQKKPEQQGNIDYLLTMSKKEFEKRLGVTIQFFPRQSDGRPYGRFTFQGRNFIVSVSKNLNPEKLPEDTQISLTRTAVPCEFYLCPTTPRPSVLPTELRVGYLLHKPLRSYAAEAQQRPTEEAASSELKDALINLTKSCPELELKDDMGIIESYNLENLLARLVESDFDLSLLP